MQIVANYIHVLVLQTCFFKSLIVAWKTRKLVVKNISYLKINRVTQSKIRYRTLVKINIFAIFKKGPFRFGLSYPIWILPHYCSFKHEALFSSPQENDIHFLKVSFNATHCTAFLWDFWKLSSLIKSWFFHGSSNSTNGTM